MHAKYYICLFEVYLVLSSRIPSASIGQPYKKSPIYAKGRGRFVKNTIHQPIRQKADHLGCDLNICDTLRKH